MNADLEATLAELGGDYRELVVRMKAAYEPRKLESMGSSRPVAISAVARRGRIWGWSVGYLVAASVLVLVGLAVVFGISPKSGAPLAETNEFMLAHLRTAAAVDEMIRTQRPDGGWGNDFITRQNIAALSGFSSDAARLARRKALRNLRLRGLL